MTIGAARRKHVASRFFWLAVPISWVVVAALMSLLDFQYWWIFIAAATLSTAWRVWLFLWLRRARLRAQEIHD